ncbi:MAG: biotin/lipoyl-containing protein, partial [Hyphomonas sp.]
MPDVGEGVAEAEIVVWHVNVGDTVKEDQSLVEVMTDKATVDMTSPVDGVIRVLHGEIGQMIPVGAVLLEIEVEGETEADDLPAAEVAKEQGPPPKEVAIPVAEAPSRTVVHDAGRVSKASASWPGRKDGEAPLAAPATRQRAYELGIPLQFIPGTGPGGRITPEDLDEFISGGAGTLP